MNKGKGLGWPKAATELKNEVKNDRINLFSRRIFTIVTLQRSVQEIRLDICARWNTISLTKHCARVS